MPWKSTTNLRARITERERYNKYLRSEVRRQHEKLMRYREVAKDAFANIDRNEKRLFLMAFSPEISTCRPDAPWFLKMA